MLDFKLDVAQLMEKEESSQNLSCLEKSGRFKSLYKIHQEQWENVSLSSNKADQFKHLEQWFDSYRAFSEQEYVDFFKQHKEVIKDEIHGDCALIVGGGLVSFGVLSFAQFLFGTTLSLFTLLGALVSVLGLSCILFTGIKVRSAIEKVIQMHSNKKDVSPFLKKNFFVSFVSNGHLRKVANLNKEGSDELEVFGMKSKNLKRIKKLKNKDWLRIHEYEETKAWYRQWTQNGKVPLHVIEVKALVGMSKKYGDYLTPVPHMFYCDF